VVKNPSVPSALSGVKVVDFSRVLAGPLATMVLADLGAEVTKIEPPGGDETRQWGPPYDADGEATYFQAVNRNKSSLVLDLNAHDDHERARRLALDADVLVENFRPGVMDRFGFGYEELHAEHPGLVYCTITGFGRHGGATLPGYDLLIQALGGLMSVTGTPDGEPQKVGVALVDVLAGLFASVGIMAALRHREQTGEGQRVEVELLSALLAGLVNQASAYTIAGATPHPMGNQHPSIAPYELFETGDGELVLAVGNDRQFAALCETLQAPELADDERFASNGARVEHRSELRRELEQRLTAHTARDWVEQLTAARVPAGVVNDIGAAFALAQSLGLEPLVTLPRDDGTTVDLPRNPITLSATPATYRSPPPRLGPESDGR
jgi:crotonobetainyl-CoA:carnitine CoA-transferase CaiB-like acyl-CoA transferase